MRTQTARMKFITLGLGLLSVAAFAGCREEASVSGVSATGTEATASTPADPTGLTVSGLTSSSVTLSWTDNASNELIYEIEQCAGSGCTSFAAIATSPRPANTNSINLTGLSTATTYRFRVRATNSYQTSQWLVSGDVSTSAVGVNAPTSLTTTTVASTSLAFSWADNATNETGYAVESCSGTGCSSFAAIAGSPLAANSTSVNITGLTPSTVYRVRVRAVSGGSFSTYISSLDVMTGPAAPTVFVAGAISATSIAFSWTDNASDETSYAVESCNGTGCTNFTAVASSPRASNTTSHIETGLSENTIYRFRVKASNANGDSSYLTSGDLSTVIAAPTALSASSISDTALTLSWTDNSAVELIYEIQMCTGTGCSAYAAVPASPRPSNTGTVSVSGLSQSTIYGFRVRATNSQGSSAWLTSGDVTTTATAVSNPTSLLITGKTSTSVSVSWADNATNETGYTVESCSGPGCTVYTAVAGSPFAANTTAATVSGLTSSSTYRVRVRAFSASTQSAYITSNDITTPPTPPTVLAVGAVSTNSIAFSWTDNSSDELIFDIEKCTGTGCSVFSSASASPQPANTTSYTESGLLENTVYRFRVRATNSNGSSTYVTSGDITTLMASPTVLTVGSVADTTLVLGWNDNSNSETGYEVQQCTGSGCVGWATSTGSPVAANSVGANVTGLTPSTTYRFRTRAAGAVPSAYLTSGDITTAPAAPTALVIGSVTYSTFPISWNDNASDETSYSVERCAGASCSNFAVLATLAANSVSYTDSTVAGSTTYKYRVRAVNANGSSAYLTSAATATLAAPVTPLACTAPNTVTIDYGAQLGVAATARGIWSDVKYIPTGVTTGTGAATGNVVAYSTNAGVAYVDVGAQVLKYSFSNGTTFKTETVYGDAVAAITYVRLGYLSNSPNAGLPIIFFTNGTSNNGQIMMAVRNTASLTATGSWTVSAIDTNAGAPNRALELAISPIDQVGLVYQGATLPTANNIRFVYCSSGCNSAGSYVAASNGATNRVDTTALATTQTHIGIGWCQMSSGVYNPQVVYGASALTYTLAACNAGSNTLTSCLTNAGWTKTTAAIAVTGASGITSDLYLDPSIIGDSPKILVKDVGGAQMKTFSTSANCNAIVAGTTYTAAGSSAITGSAIAAYGSSWLKILKWPDYATQANERFFIVANDGTTAMKWSASTTSSFNGAWSANAAGAIHTVTLGAAGAAGMGADLNVATKQLITAYGAAAGTFNVTLGVVNDFTTPGDPGAATNVYYQLPIEAAGHMQLNASQITNIAMASTSTSRPGVTWVDFSSGAATTGKLKYALRTGAAASTSAWTVYTIPGTSGTYAPQFPSIAFDNNDRPWIGYWDNQGAAGRYILTTNTSSDGSGAWSSYMFPVVSAGHGAPVALPAGNATAVAMSYVSGVASPVLIVIDNGTTPAVKSAKLNPATGAWSAVATIESLSLQGGAFLTADFSTSANVVEVAYQNLLTGTVRVKYAASTDGGVTWPTNASTATGVSGFAQGEGARIKINPKTGLPGISYYDRANNKLFYAACTSNCTGTSTPVFSGTAASVLNGIGISGLSVAGNANLLNAGLTYSAGGDPYIVYNSGALDFGALRVVDGVGGTVPSGLPTTVINGVNGAFSSAAATNGGIPWNQVVTRMPNGVLATSYISAGNYLNVSTCGD